MKACIVLTLLSEQWVLPWAPPLSSVHSQRAQSACSCPSPSCGQSRRCSALCIHTMNRACAKSPLADLYGKISLSNINHCAKISSFVVPKHIYKGVFFHVLYLRQRYSSLLQQWADMTTSSLTSHCWIADTGAYGRLATGGMWAEHQEDSPGCSKSLLPMQILKPRFR